MNTSLGGTKLRTVMKAMAFTLALVWAAGTLAAESSAARPAGEYEVKAAFLYNFITFTDWPSTAFSGPTSPIVIGLVGKDPFGPALDAMMKGELVKDRRLIVWRVNRVEDMSRCHVLFVSGSESRRLPEILHRLKSEPVLTVSDIEGFAEAGGAVGFTTDKNVRLTINPATLQAARLTVSAKLLRLARLVEQTLSTP